MTSKHHFLTKKNPVFRSIPESKVFEKSTSLMAILDRWPRVNFTYLGQPDRTEVNEKTGSEDVVEELLPRRNRKIIGRGRHGGGRGGVVAARGQLEIQPQCEIGCQVDAVRIDDDHAAAAVVVLFSGGVAAAAAAAACGMRGELCRKTGDESSSSS